MNMLNSIDDIIMTEDNTLSIDSPQFDLRHENLTLLPVIDNSNMVNGFTLNYDPLLMDNLTEYNDQHIVNNITENQIRHKSIEENTTRRMWSMDMVKALIEEYSELINEFKSPACKQRNTWQELASNMRMRGFTVNWQQCDKKWRNLKQTFRSIHEDQTREYLHKCRWEPYEDLLIIFSTDETEKQRDSDNEESDEEFLIADNEGEISNDGCDLNIEYDENVAKSSNENEVEILDYDNHITALNTLIETPSTSNISDILAKAYLSIEDSPTEHTEHENIEFLVNDIPETATYSNQEEMPTWFKNFTEQYHKNENRRLEALQKMHNESLEVEKKKVALLEMLLAKFH